MDCHNSLRNLLRLFAFENKCQDHQSWDTGDNVHYFIAKEDDEFIVAHAILLKYQGVVYFPSEEYAERAIEEIVKPFMTEHPEFVW